MMKFKPYQLKNSKINIWKKLTDSNLIAESKDVFMKELQTEPFTNMILAVRNQLDSQSNIFLTLNLFIFLLGFDG